MRSSAEERAMARAVELAASVPGPILPNPRVGCVLLAPDGTTIAEGVHRGAGTPHAEADALRSAGDRAGGATAIVTLEPCNHTGRTGPCAQALIEAGVARVVIGRRDPNPIAAGGADRLSAAGIGVEFADAPEAHALTHRWSTAVARRRPWVIWKTALTLDGRIAAADGTSRWITSPEARADVHRLRAEADTVLVGTGTVLADDPALTVRDAAGQPSTSQPLRAVMGHRPIPTAARLRDDAASTVHLATHDPAEALRQLWELERRHVFLEGGATLAAAFLRAHLVDEIVAYIAPVLLGAGPAAVADLGITTLADALRPTLTEVSAIPGAEATTARLVLTPQEVTP